MNHPVAWQTPQPLWSRFGASAAANAASAASAASTVASAAASASASAAALSPDQARPALLRFDSDDYMEQLLAALEHDPASLGDRIARPETWRLPLGDAPDLVERLPLPRLAKTLARLRKDQAPRSALPAVTGTQAVTENGVARTLPLKLYQPAHMRHYLVAANLVCAQPGLPDRTLGTGGSEQVGFVIRRLMSPTAGAPRVEYAFVKSPAGPRWQRVAAEGAVEPGEDLLPLFSMGFVADNGQPRRLHAGTVPVGRREEYMSTRAQHVVGAEGPGATGASGAISAAGVAAMPSAIATRKEQFKLDVAEPWKQLLRSAVYAKGRIVDPASTATAAQRLEQAVTTNRQLQGQSWLVLLDFADYLATHVPGVWSAVQSPALGTGLTGAAKALFDWMNAAATAMGSNWPGLADSPAISVREALRRIRGARASLEGTTALYPDAPGAGLAWPDFRWLLAGVRDSGGFVVAGLHTTLPAVTVDPADVEAGTPSMTPLQQEAEAAAALVDKAVQLVIAAIDTAQPAAPSPALPFAARLRDALVTTQGDAGWFVIRCAYLRCDCGPLKPAVLSAPSERFQLASFFDSDAPARPIRIALPLDTTPAGLRKHQKNAAFLMSDQLCGQVQRAKGLGFVDLVRSVLPWPLYKPLDVGGMGPCAGGSPQASLGMICSLSLPIITLCALILLMIIVSLLDFVFRWLPYFVMCFPVPKFKGKGGGDGSDGGGS
ncbi:hypothetical protein [Roseateles amylovorans]|uniref:Uncharacterized protein n=1 Tax=Roseateles amylovorans TaxID=2978473 RepID=A0ABY6B370_9BURK|nr:hypothetical protein [Roseateles amylovorans]UXH79165.1 hypothetical protein N4261_04295 [Roseateles amylovorans]